MLLAFYFVFNAIQHQGEAVSFFDEFVESDGVFRCCNPYNKSRSGCRQTLGTRTIDLSNTEDGADPERKEFVPTAVIALAHLLPINQIPL